MSEKLPLRKLPDILPRPLGQSSDPPKPPPKDSSKRRDLRVSIACIQCRKRKTRCSGEQPCSACIDRESRCVYDYRSDRRRRDALAQDTEIFHKRRDELVNLLNAVHGCSEGVYEQALTMVRKGDLITDITEFLNSTSNVVPQSAPVAPSPRTPVSGSEAPGSSIVTSRTFSSMSESSSAGFLSGISSPVTRSNITPPNIHGTFAFAPRSVEALSSGFGHHMSHSEASSSGRGSGTNISTSETAQRSSTMETDGMQVAAGDQSQRPVLIRSDSDSPSRRKIGPLTAFPVWQFTTGPESISISAPVLVEEEHWDGLESSIAQTMKYWTTIMIDPRHIAHLFTLYKSVWGTSVYFFLDFDLFLRDMVPCVMAGDLSGTGNYFFSCELANALLAIGCFFCTRNYAFADIFEPMTRGEHFIQETINQIKRCTTPRLTTAQAYACLALADGCRNRLGSSRRLWLCCLDMFLFLLKAPKPMDLGSERAEPGEQRQDPDLENVPSSLPTANIEQDQMKLQIKKSVVAIGLFCVESIYLTEINAPHRTSLLSHSPPLPPELFMGDSSSAYSHDIAVVGDTLIPTDNSHLTEEDKELIDVLSVMKLQLATHSPPGFLTPEYQDSEELTGWDTAETISMAFPELGAIYKRFRVLWQAVSPGEEF